MATPNPVTPLIISYFTVGTPYEELAKRLSENLESFGLRHDIRGLQDTGKWVTNCALKGPFVLKMMEEMMQPLVWLDLDAEVMKFPKLFTELGEYDLAVYIHKKKRGNVELISNVALFNPTPKCLETLKEWARLCEKDTHTWDQKLLHLAVQRKSPHVFMLPDSYNVRYMPGQPTKWLPVKEVVIRQYQVSRAVKGRKRAHPDMVEIFGEVPRGKGKKKAKDPKKGQANKRKRPRRHP